MLKNIFQIITYLNTSVPLSLFINKLNDIDKNNDKQITLLEVVQEVVKIILDTKVSKSR